MLKKNSKSVTIIVTAIVTIIFLSLIPLFTAACNKVVDETEIPVEIEEKEKEPSNIAYITKVVYVNEAGEELKDEQDPRVTKNMAHYHELAEELRALGISDDSDAIRRLQELYMEELKSLKILAKTIYGEAPYCPMEHQLAVGCVVMNRVRHPSFPDTVEAVVASPGQYNLSYVRDYDNLPEEFYSLARMVLDGEYSIPENVVYQSNGPQGSGIWWESYVNTGYWASTTYFCYR